MNPAGQVQLGEYPRDMGFGGQVADVEPFTNLSVAQSIFKPVQLLPMRYGSLLRTRTKR